MDEDEHVKEVTVSIYENQRWYPIKGWSSSLMLTDRFNWSSADGTQKLTKDFPCPKQFLWKNVWAIDKNKNTDGEGWEYAMDFTSSYTANATTTDCVRRRIWNRTMMEITQSATHNFHVDATRDAAGTSLDDGIAAPAAWLKDSDVTACMHCKSSFGMFKGKHHCRLCGKIFCDTCTPYSNYAKGQRACLNCIKENDDRVAREKKAEEEKKKAEAERKEMLAHIAHQITMNEELEKGTRQELLDQNDKLSTRLKQIEQKEKGWVVEKLKEEEANKKQDEIKAMQGEQLDHWAATPGPRSASLWLVVVRAQNLVPPGMFLTCSTTVVVKTASVEFESNYIKDDASPEWDFETYMAIEDDTKPVTFIVRNWTLGFPKTIAHASLNLRGDYKNLIRTVTADGVYQEKGHCILDMLKGDHVLPDTSITCHWKLEAREANKTVFCDDCGYLEFKCKCPPEERAARREAAAKAEAARLEAEQAAKDKRLEEEYKKKKEEEEKRKAEAEKKFKQGVAELERRQAKNRVESAVFEQRERDGIEKQFREGFHQVRVKEEKEKVRAGYITMALASEAKNDNMLRRGKLDIWMAWVSIRKEEKRKSKEDELAATEHYQHRKEANQELQKQEAIEKEVNKKKSEQKYQDDAKEQSDVMVNDYYLGTAHGGRPRGVRVHDDEAIEAEKKKKEEKEKGGCCCIS